MKISDIAKSEVLEALNKIGDEATVITIATHMNEKYSDSSLYQILKILEMEGKVKKRVQEQNISSRTVNQFFWSTTQKGETDGLDHENLDTDHVSGKVVFLSLLGGDFHENGLANIA